MTNTGDIATPAAESVAPKPPALETGWFLSGQTGESGATRNVAINASPFTVGRRTDTTLSLLCNSVSSLHASIEFQGDELWLTDQGSTNGTFVNGQRVNGRVRLHEGDFIQFATVVFRLFRRDADAPMQTMEAAGACDQALALIQFERLMSDQALIPYYQPIVKWGQGPPEVIGYEVLSRSRLLGLQTPATMFLAAALLNQEVQLSQYCRAEGMRVSQSLAVQPHLFLNTHPTELETPAELCASLTSLRSQFPDVPLTLEIHEAAVADTKTMQKLKAAMADLSIGLAYDDFGAGQARLLELAEVPPDFLKFDRKLIQRIHLASAERQEMLASLVQMVRKLGIFALAEGVESLEEGDVCQRLGFEYSQGFFYGRPAPVEKL